MTELKNARVWFDPNTGRLQVTAQVGPVGRIWHGELKHATLRLEYGSSSYSESSVKAPRRRRGGD